MNNKMKYKPRILREYKVGNQVAYLKRQSDGRYTINTGSRFDSGYDTWFHTEATSDSNARGIFRVFITTWFGSMDDNETRLDELSDYDIYTIDISEYDDYE